MPETVLALEWSTRRVSAALRTGDAAPRERVEELDRFRAPTAVASLEMLLAEAGAAPGDLSEIRVGRGPGNYSGIRQAVAWTVGAAAPGGIRVRAIASGRVQALRLLRENPAPVWILGDARRGRFWGARFAPDAADEAEWTLRPPADWSRLMDGERAVSAEADRLKGDLHVQADYPRASDMLAPGCDSTEEPLAPLYLHPPVGTAGGS